MKWIRKNLVNLILMAIMLTGIGLLTYPSLADYWNSFHQSKAIAGYVDYVAELNNEEYKEILSDAQTYNEEIAKNGISWNLNKKQKRIYEETLDIAGSGIMGYIEIDKIGCYLPIYHGTEDTVLQIAIGHIEGSSLPVGGESSHCILSGHRGLPSAKLFTNLDEMVEGDIFVIRVLDETFTYEVDQITIVEPDDLSQLQIVRGMDYCTLVTCTPYGINTHRLLVRGHRIDNLKESASIRVTSDAMQIEPVVVAPLIAIPVLVILIIYVISSGERQKRHNRMFTRIKEEMKNRMHKSE